MNREQCIPSVIVTAPQAVGEFLAAVLAAASDAAIESGVAGPSTVILRSARCGGYAARARERMHKQDGRQSDYRRCDYSFHCNSPFLAPRKNGTGLIRKTFSVFLDVAETQKVEGCEWASGASGRERKSERVKM